MPRLTTLVHAVALAAALFPLQLPADPVADQIDAAKRAYAAGDEQVAIQALEFAIAQIQDKLKAEQLGLLPEPLPGWSADEPISDAGGIAAMFTGTTLTRSYRRLEDGATVTVTVTADSPVLSMLSTLMQANPSSSPYTRGGYRGVLEMRDGATSRILLMIGTRIQAQVEGSGVDQQTLEAYLDAIDFSALEKALLG